MACKTRHPTQITFAGASTCWVLAILIFFYCAFTWTFWRAADITLNEDVLCSSATGPLDIELKSSDYDAIIAAVRPTAPDTWTPFSISGLRRAAGFGSLLGALPIISGVQVLYPTSFFFSPWATSLVALISSIKNIAWPLSTVAVLESRLPTFDYSGFKQALMTSAAKTNIATAFNSRVSNGTNPVSDACITALLNYATDNLDNSVVYYNLSKPLAWAFALFTIAVIAVAGITSCGDLKDSAVVVNLKKRITEGFERVFAAASITNAKKPLTTQPLQDMVDASETLKILSDVETNFEVVAKSDKPEPSSAPSSSSSSSASSAAAPAAKAQCKCRKRVPGPCSCIGAYARHHTKLEFDVRGTVVIVLILVVLYSAFTWTFWSAADVTLDADRLCGDSATTPGDIELTSADMEEIITAVRPATPPAGFDVFSIAGLRRACGYGSLFNAIPILAAVQVVYPTTWFYSRASSTIMALMTVTKNVLFPFASTAIEMTRLPAFDYYGFKNGLQNTVKLAAAFAHRTHNATTAVSPTCVIALENWATTNLENKHILFNVSLPLAWGFALCVVLILVFASFCMAARAKDETAGKLAGQLAKLAETRAPAQHVKDLNEAFKLLTDLKAASATTVEVDLKAANIEVLTKEYEAKRDAEAKEAEQMAQLDFTSAQLGAFAGAAVAQHPVAPSAASPRALQPQVNDLIKNVVLTFLKEAGLRMPK